VPLLHPTNSVKPEAESTSRLTPAARPGSSTQNRRRRTMRNAVRLLITAIAIGSIGCQRSYITSDNPSYPLKNSQISTAKWSNKMFRNDSETEKLKNFVTRHRAAEQ
jgi:hypothetical protein